MGLFSLHNCWVSCSLDYITSTLEAKSRLPIPEFYGSHCKVVDPPRPLGLKRTIQHSFVAHKMQNARFAFQPEFYLAFKPNKWYLNAFDKKTVPSKL